MAITKGNRLTTVLVLALSYFLHETEGHRGHGLATPATSNASIFDVTDFGAKGNGKPVYLHDESFNGLAIMKAWQKACHCSAGPSKVVIPKGKFVVAEVIFAGPCKNHVTIELQGNMIADSDVSQFPNHEFIVFQNVSGVTFTGHGTIDVSHQAKQLSNSDVDNEDTGFFNLMPSIKLYKVKNILVERIRSVNPAAYHVLVVESQCVTISNVKFDAKSMEPNTNSNGIYISSSSQVSVANSYIRTGDDCVTVAPGSIDVSITGLICAAGEGIGIGSRPYTTALDIKGVTIRDCTFKGTTFGVRIIPRLEVEASLISDIKVEGLIMDRVQNPIVINQLGQLQSLPRPNQLIQAKIVGVSLKNIRGTTTTQTPLSFSCNPDTPCEGIKVADIDLSLIDKVSNGKIDVNLNKIVDKTLQGKGLGFLVNCLNAKVLFRGKNDGLSCGLLQ